MHILGVVAVKNLYKYIYYRMCLQDMCWYVYHKRARINRKHKQQKMQCAKTHLRYYCCINGTNMEGRLFLEGWRQRVSCWRSRPPATLWLANRWPLCQTWTMGQHYLHIKSLSEQELLSLHSPVSLILKDQLVYVFCVYVSCVRYRNMVFFTY